MSDSMVSPKNDTAALSARTGEKPLIPPKYLYLGIGLAVLLVVVVVALVVLGVRNPVHTQTVRDIAIIALALQSGLIGLALIVLIIQIARLINMLEFEIKPILTHTSDTVNTLRGTATFMSEHVVSPMIKASGYASGIARLASSVGGVFSTGQKRQRRKSVSDAGPRLHKGGET